jgi:CheY-like chemotaxis protein
MGKILIVDDDPLILLSLKRTIKKDHLEVMTVQTGGDAVAAIEDSFYNLCFLDVHLPDINGIEVMRKIKEVSPGTRVVIMTSDDLCDNDKRDVEYNAYDFIPKPFDLLRIKTVVKHVMGEDAGFIDRRSVERKSLTMPIEFIFDLVIGESKTLSFRATVLDMCKSGIGIRTENTLHCGQAIVFKLGTEHKKGIVRWISVKHNAAENDSYRAGIKLLQAPTSTSERFPTVD